jgi:hypothetical protein
MLGGLVARGAIVLVLCGTAPFQCSSEPDPNRAIEESPGEALFRLAEQFKADGDEKARARTLRYLVERYPSSRFARMAEQDLAAMGKGPAESD